MKELKLEETIEDIKKYFQLSVDQNFEDSVWAAIWRNYAIGTLKCAKERLKHLSEGRMEIYDETLEHRPFWISIMHSVQKSIWTTNIASKGTFGSQLDELLSICLLYTSPSPRDS